MEQSSGNWSNGSGSGSGGTYCDVLTRNASVREATLDALLGPQQTELVHLVVYVSLYALLFLAGIVGNVVNGMVLLRHIRTANATGIYLLNLLLADLLLIILGIPTEIVQFVHHRPWLFGETLCILRSVFAETASYATVMTITAFTVERYFAVTRPIHTHLGTRSRAFASVVLIWIAAFSAGISMGLQFGVSQIFHDDGGGGGGGGGGACFIPNSELCMLMPEREIEHSFTVSSVVFFFLPLTLITVLHVLIAVHLRRSSALIKRLTTVGTDDKTPTPTQTQTQTQTPTATTQWLANDGVPLAELKPRKKRRYALRADTAEKPNTDTSTSQGVRSSLKPHCRNSTTERLSFSDTQCVASSSSCARKRERERGRSTLDVNDRKVSAVNKTLIMVCCCFFVCFAPFMIQRLFSRNMSIDGDAVLEVVNEYFFFVAGLLYYSSAIINPVIYNLMSRKFRAAFRRELARIRCRRRRRRQDGSLERLASRSASVYLDVSCSSPAAAAAALDPRRRDPDCFRVRSLTARNTVHVYREAAAPPNNSATQLSLTTS